jgi:hypothetical protein
MTVQTIERRHRLGDILNALKGDDTGPIALEDSPSNSDSP